ncbi:MAG: hypothetical protein A2Y17_07490 [Clostridiales bacterium GWF2_38_85]|nr:MAG: hypothetical protein A2Y17_07490 [Clostridiales bacterium GWF2_38_85]
MVFLLLPITVSADTGPKPSVNITFENMGDELCYCTLLSNTDYFGPYSVWNGDESNITNYNYYNLDKEVWRAFVEYEDTDGYVFLQIGQQVNETKKFVWGYSPPMSFKILLYYPETETFLVSGIYERYAFDTYYTVDMDGVKTDNVNNNQILQAYKSYNYVKETTALIARIIITILIEMGVALLFYFREKKQLIFIAAVNIVTQIILNVLLNDINYNSGLLLFTISYIFFEIIIFALEAILYCIVMNRINKQPKKFRIYVAYSLVANAVSFITGLIIAYIVPGMF